MQSFRLYGTNIPSKGEYVNFIFTERNKHELKTYLLDYHVNGFMTYAEATTRRRVRSWNNIAPLDKPMIGFVEEIVKLSITNLVSKKAEIFWRRLRAASEVRVNRVGLEG